MKRKTIELKEFEYKSQYDLKRLYDIQDRPFVIETVSGEITTVILAHKSPDFYFVSDAGVIYPMYVSFIEFIPEWGML